MKKIVSVICLTIIFSLTLSSCKSKEEKVIDQLGALAEKVENNSADWDSEQWSDALEELEKIHEKMADCDFTTEQLRSLGEVEGRLTGIIMREGAKAVEKGLGSFMQGAGSFIKGFQEGAASATDESFDKFEDIENSVNQALDKIMNEIEDYQE